MSRVVLEPAFVLHARPFRDTSLLLDLFTLHHGRIGAIARGARSLKSKTRGLLLPFVPLLISWSGKTELVSVSKIEPSSLAYDLMGDSLLSGMYLNELLVRLLHRHDAHPNVYLAYQNVLMRLQSQKNIQIALRIFEKNLLVEIGYGLQFNKDSNDQDVIADAAYYYEHERGFVKTINSGKNTFSGSSLLALHKDNFTETNKTLIGAKKLMRLVFNQLLNGRPLKSRELFTELL